MFSGNAPVDAQQFQVAEHALKRIVELVRDARDEVAEGRELLGLQQATSQFLALAHAQ